MRNDSAAQFGLGYIVSAGRSNMTRLGRDGESVSPSKQGASRAAQPIGLGAVVQNLFGGTLGSLATALRSTPRFQALPDADGASVKSDPQPSRSTQSGGWFSSLAASAASFFGINPAA